MNGNKLAKILNRIFHIVFLLGFGFTFLSIIFAGYSDESEKYVKEERIWIVLTFVLLLVIFTAAYIFIQRYTLKPPAKRIKSPQYLTNRNVKIMIFSAIGVMLVIQLIMGYLLQMDPVTDLKNINKYAYDFAEKTNYNLIQKDLINNDYAYLIRYPNNFGVLFFLSFLYKVAYSIFGYIPSYLPVAVNAVAINASVLLTVFIARKVFGNRKALFVLLLSFLFLPFFTYVPYYYTDSLSMPFFVGAIYLFISAIKSDSKYKKYVLMATCGVVTLLGCKIKGSLILLLAVAIVYLFLNFKFKRSLCLILALVAGFGVVSTAYTVAFNSMGIVTKEQSDKYEYPYTHWVMMGLNDLGHYNFDDDYYTRSFPDKASKQEANIEEIKDRIKDYGVCGLAKHTVKKAVWIWQDGTYFISHHIKKCLRENVLHSFILDGHKGQPIFFVYSCGFQLFLMFMICMSVLKGCINPKVNIQTLFKGIVFASFVFFILWESRSRYLYNFAPIFLLLSVDGLDFVSKKLVQLSSMLRK